MDYQIQYAIADYLKVTHFNLILYSQKHQLQISYGIFVKECAWNTDQFKQASQISWQDHFTYIQPKCDQETQTYTKQEISYDSISKERENNLRRELESEKLIFMREESAKIRKEEQLKYQEALSRAKFELKRLEEQLRIDCKKKEMKAAQLLEQKYTSLLNQVANERMKLKEDQNQVFLQLTSLEIEKQQQEAEMNMKLSKIDELKKSLQNEIKQTELDRLKLPNEFEELHKKHLEELKLKETEQATTDEMKQIILLKEQIQERDKVYFGQTIIIRQRIVKLERTLKVTNYQNDTLKEDIEYVETQRKIIFKNLDKAEKEIFDLNSLNTYSQEGYNELKSIIQKLQGEHEMMRENVEKKEKEIKEMKQINLSYQMSQIKIFQFRGTLLSEYREIAKEV